MGNLCCCLKIGVKKANRGVGEGKGRGVLIVGKVPEGNIAFRPKYLFYTHYMR
jgi:hypothetical protein